MKILVEWGLVDTLSLGWFICAWIGYTYFSGYRAKSAQRLQNTLHGHISDWVHVIQKRDARIVDISIAANLERNATFMASSSLLIIAGLLTLIGSSGTALDFVTDLTVRQYLAKHELEFKVIFLVLIFVFAFFTFTWCLRQWGMASILIGSAPLCNDDKASEESRNRHAKSLAGIIQLAVVSFNHGLRAFYFSIAWMTWFIHPYAFLITTTWVLLVLYRREFHSRTLKALKVGTEWSRDYRSFD